MKNVVSEKSPPKAEKIIESISCLYFTVNKKKLDKELSLSSYLFWSIILFRNYQFNHFLGHSIGSHFFYHSSSFLSSALSLAFFQTDSFTFSLTLFPRITKCGNFIVESFFSYCIICCRLCQFVPVYKLANIFVEFM